MWINLNSTDFGQYDNKIPHSISLSAIVITLRSLIYSIKIQSQLSSYNDVAVVGTVYKSCDQFTDAYI